jgi:hypothetical protein
MDEKSEPVIILGKIEFGNALFGVTGERFL